uniref:Uncharacterized protein n=1 Tax=Leersia perrieri TaxID=77586 RepID=A0A0D9VU16_9ORYZ
MGKAAGGRGWWGEGEERGRRRWRWCSAQPWCFRRCSGCPRSRGGAGWRDGSRVAPPTIVQTSVLLAVGTDRKPSLQRLKELAQTLKNSSSGNLGLNHTVFGKVAHIHQVQLLNLIISPHTTHQDNNHDHYSHHHHHHHSHHHHHRHHDLNHQGLQHFPPAPAPLHNIPTFLSFDSSCMLKKLHTDAKRHSVPHMDPSFRHMTPVASPNSYEASGPYADPPSLHPRIPLSPLPAVEFHAMPPSESVETLKHHYNISLWPVVLPLVAHHITCIPVHVTTVEMFLPDGEVPEKLGSPLCKQTQLSNTLDGFFGDPSCKYMYNAAEGDVVVVKAVMMAGSNLLTFFVLLLFAQILAGYG